MSSNDPPKIRDTIKSDHLYIIASDPLPNGDVLVFNLTTSDWDSDKTCEVKVGDHPYVEHDSVVAYQYAETRTPRAIARLKMLASPVAYEPVSEKLFVRILEGAIKSPDTADYVKAIVREILAKMAKSSS